MSTVEAIIGLAVVAVLVGYLYHKHRQRVRCLAPPPPPADWKGTAIDAAKLKPALERVRRDYLASRGPFYTNCYHKALLELAQRAVRELGFFRERTAEQAAHRQAG